MAGEVKNNYGAKVTLVGGKDASDDLIGAGVFLNYEDRWAERVSNLTPGAGTIDLDSAVVPAGSVYVLEAASAQDISSALTEIRLLATDGTAFVVLAQALSPAAGTAARWSGPLVLKAGDYLRARFYGVVAGDDLYLDLWGRKVKVS